MNVWEYAERFGIDPDICWDKEYTEILFANGYQAQKNAKLKWDSEQRK